MPQMSPIMWMVYPYILILVMMIFMITLIKEDEEFKSGWGDERGVGIVMLW